MSERARALVGPPIAQAGESVILKDELGDVGATERSTTVYRDCFRPRRFDPIPAEMQSSAVAARWRETTFRLDDGRPPVYSCTSNDAFRPNLDHRNYSRSPVFGQFISLIQYKRSKSIFSEYTR